MRKLRQDWGQRSFQAVFIATVTSWERPVREWSTVGQSACSPDSSAIRAGIGEAQARVFFKNQQKSMIDDEGEASDNPHATQGGDVSPLVRRSSHKSRRFAASVVDRPDRPVQEMEVSVDPSLTSCLTAGLKQIHNPNDHRSWPRPFRDGEFLCGIGRTGSPN